MLVFLFILIVFKFWVNTVWLDIPQCHQEKESKEEEKLITPIKKSVITSSCLKIFQLFTSLKKKKKKLEKSVTGFTNSLKHNNLFQRYWNN